MPVSTARERLIATALRLFTHQGFDATTVDQIASEAGVGRTTFFRNFPTKEDVVFPQHEPILMAVEARLVTAAADTANIALFEASGIVLRHYLEEGDIARTRYALTRSIPALRDAEIARQRDYQQIFRAHAIAWGLDELGAELLANGVVTAHNFVLRRWLRGLAKEPFKELEAALGRLDARPAAPSNLRGELKSKVIIVESGRDARTVADAVHRALLGLDLDERANS